MPQNQAKIISLVPSWTETLLSCGLQVVGRTRFCLYPAESINKVPIVGGTKNFNLEEILKLAPDFVLLDKEENKKEMSLQLEQAGIQLIVSHVQSVRTAADFLQELSIQLQNEKLRQLADRYDLILSSTKLSREKFFKNSLINASHETFQQVLMQNQIQYIIWKNPYMGIGVKTFIQDVFSLVNMALVGNDKNEKYPVLNLDDLQKDLCLFSTEPYPFLKEAEQLEKLNLRYGFIDGEKISWYGLRNLLFLEACVADER